MSSTARAVVLCLALTGCGAAYHETAGSLSLPRATAAPVASAADPALATGAAGTLSGPLTLRKAVEIALGRGYSILMAREERKAAEGQITEARAGALPSIGLRANYTRMDKALEFDTTPMGGPGVVEMGALDNYSAALTLQQPLYLGGKARAARRIADENRRAVEHDIGAAEQGIVFLVHRHFYDALLAEEDVRAAEEALGIAGRHVDDVKGKLEQGMATRFEVTRAETRLSAAQTDAIRARNALKLARTSLFTLLRLPLENGIEIEGTLAFSPSGADRDAAAETALLRRPDLARQEALLRMQREKLRVTAADRKPTVFVTGEAGYEDPSQRSLGGTESDTYWRAGLGASVPVFDGLRTKGRLAQDQARLTQLELGRQELVDRIRLEVAQALLNLRDAEELVASQGKVLEQAREGLRLAQAGYEEGVNRQLDVLDAQQGLTEARRGHARAIYAHLLAGVALEKAKGTLGIDLEKGDMQ